MKVKEWIKKLQKMPEDTEVYWYYGEYGEWDTPVPEFIDLNHKDFEECRKYCCSTVPEEKPYVHIIGGSEGDVNFGINLYEKNRVVVEKQNDE